MKVVVVTGASSGIGYSIAEFLSKKQFRVYGISRSNFTLANVIHMQGDVTNEERIFEIIKEIYNIEGKIDFLINNAGMGISGSIEATTTLEARQILDVNVIGTFITTKAVLPYMREQKNGKIINIGSVASEFSLPFQAFYSSSKSAVRSLTEALYNEVKPYGIGVSLILPGDIKTEFSKNRKKNIDELDIYNNRVKKSIGLMEKDEQNGMTTAYASKIIYKVMRKNKMPLVKTIGNKYKLFMFLKRLFPVRFINNLVGSLYGFKKD